MDRVKKEEKKKKKKKKKEKRNFLKLKNYYKLYKIQFIPTPDLPGLSQKRYTTDIALNF